MILMRVLLILVVITETWGDVREWAKGLCYSPDELVTAEDADGRTRNQGGMHIMRAPDDSLHAFRFTLVNG